jgi:hypothetical protein
MDTYFIIVKLERSRPFDLDSIKTSLKVYLKDLGHCYRLLKIMSSIQVNVCNDIRTLVENFAYFHF